LIKKDIRGKNTSSRASYTWRFDKNKPITLRIVVERAEIVIKGDEWNITQL